ncbi:MAG: NACHT domain-containing protein [Leptolyngbyaceae cyanobacterium bins.302]|nr:NACHT domain-containing protein [Leptolyngbyaceae cyanobacterium bins.302]
MSDRSLQATSQGINQAKVELKGLRMNQTQLAERLGVTRQPISKFFNGKPVSNDLFVQICEVLDLDWQEVCGLEQRNSEVVKLEEDVLNTDELVRQVRDRCCDKILTKHNCIQVWTDKILERIEVEQLFVPIFVFPEPGSQRESRQRNQHPEPVIDVVSRHQHLLILGKPGAGKSTLAHRLALISCKEESKVGRIPVLLRLSKTDSNSAFNLTEKLGKAFNTELNVTQQILESGKLFLILDGLDEVPGQFQQDVCQEIINFSEYFHNNKVIITCRTEAKDYYRKLLSDFDHVEIADFDRTQQNQFIKNWFSIDDKAPTSWLARRLQQYPECTSQALIAQIQRNERVQELAKTPILLSLICLVYVSKGQLPEKRSLLYKQGLEILLEDWDRDRGIEKRVDSPTYRNLSADDKCQILAELARYTFDQPDDAIAFEEETALEIIRNHQNCSPQESRKILEGIAADHGLVFRSAHRKWEFSHLTFQEYFVAQWFVQHQDWETLAESVCNPRWIGVFLIATEASDSIDELLWLMKHEIDHFFAKNNTLQKFLNWVDEKAQFIELEVGNFYKCSALRLYYFETTLALSHYLGISYGPSDELAFILDGALEHKFNSDPHFPLYLDLDFAFILNCALDRDSDFMPNFHPNPPTNQLRFELLKIIFKLCTLGNKYVECYEFCLQLVHQIPDSESDEKARKQWWQTDRQAWIEQLRCMMIKYRNIGHDWQFSQAQWSELKQYLDCIILLIACLTTTRNVNPEVRQRVEDTLLLPIAEIEKRKKHSINNEEK